MGLLPDSPNEGCGKDYCFCRILNFSNSQGLNNIGNKGVFVGKRTGELWKQNSSPMVVPLYEFQHVVGSYFYSVDSEKEGVKRS